MPVDVAMWSIWTCSAEARCTAREYWPVHARAGVMYLVPWNELRNHGRYKKTQLKCTLSLCWAP